MLRAQMTAFSLFKRFENRTPQQQQLLSFSACALLVKISSRKHNCKSAVRAQVEAMKRAMMFCRMPIKGPNKGSRIKKPLSLGFQNRGIEGPE